MKRWHWVVIGLLAGLALGGSRLAWGPAYRDSAARTLTQPLFDLAVMGRPGEWGSRLTLTDLVVHPADQWGDQWVTGRFCEESDVAHPSGKFVRARMRGDFKYRATMPYRRLPEGKGAADVYPSVRAFLDAVGPNAQRPDKYSYAWHEHTWSLLGVWTAGAVLLIGGIWPTVLALVTGAGWGRTPKEKVDYKLSPSAPACSQPDQPATAAAERQDITAEMAEMEARLADRPQPAAPPVAAPVSAPVAKLAGEVTETASQPTGPEKEYAGEYYPTVAHAPAKKEEKLG